MKVSSHGGHNEKVQGANFGGRKEHLMDRELNSLFISKLRSLGHSVEDDTDDVGRTADTVVGNQVRNINDRPNDVGFAWHLNASDGEGHGVEVLCYSSKETPMAAKISAEIAKRTGWKDRGAKIRTDVGVIRSSNCPMFLIEAGFIDNDGDMSKWNVDTITSAVIFAYFGVETQNKPVEAKPMKWTMKTGGLGIDLAQEVTNKLAEFKTKGKLVYEGDGIFYLQCDPVEDRNELGSIAWYVKDYKGWYAEVYQV